MERWWEGQGRQEEARGKRRREARGERREAGGERRCAAAHLQLLVPRLRLVPERGDIRRAHHTLHHQLRLLERRHDVVDRAEHERVPRVFERLGGELGDLPLAPHLFDHLVQRRLLRRVARDLGDHLVLRMQPQRQRPRDRELIATWQRLAHELVELVVVRGLEVRVAHAHHEGEHLPRGLDARAKRRKDGVGGQRALGGGDGALVADGELLDLRGLDERDWQVGPLG